MNILKKMDFREKSTLFKKNSGDRRRLVVRSRLRALQLLVGRPGALAAYAAQCPGDPVG